MHRYSQALYQKYMGQSEKPKSWTDDKIRRFARYCYEKAPSCGCGCGEKTLPVRFQPNKPSSENVKFKKYIPFHDRLKAPFNYTLTNEQEQAVLASIVGDGYMSLPNKDSKYPRLTWNMGNEEHGIYKLKFFDFLKPTYTVKQNPGWGSMQYTIVTSCHPCLLNIYNKYYKHGKKRENLIPEIFESLNSIGWAWFYGDDGHLGNNESCFLHTEGYGKYISKSCAKAVNKFTGIKGASVFDYIGGTPKKQRYCVKLNAECSDEFIKRIKPHMANGMEYKTGKNNINRRYRN